MANFRGVIFSALSGTDVAYKFGQEGIMAYIGKEDYMAFWLPEDLPVDSMAGNSIQLLGGEEEPEPMASEPSRGFIIQDWFGPFLLGPPTRFLRGRC
jgi:hypothetical protein